MRRRIAKSTARISLAVLLSLPFTGCNLLEKEPGAAPIVLHLSLSDSLRQYDRITVDVTSSTDTTKVLESLWSGPLPDPPEIPARTLTAAKDPFVILVRGYRGAGQLAVETLIFYESGKKRVVQSPLPPLTPYNVLGRLNPSPGVLDPPFNANILDYKLSVPATASSISWDVRAAYSKAMVTLNGLELKHDDPAREVPLPKATFIMPIMVTDLGVSKTYYVTVSPPKSLRIELDSIAYSAGTLEPAFRPDIDFYTLTIPSTESTVDLQFWPTDPPNMRLLVMAQPSISGNKYKLPSPALTSPGASTVVTVKVEKGTETKDYTFIVRRAQ